MPCSMDEERQELAVLLAHPEIARSANLVRMLTFVCEKYFEGRVADIRESVIAVQALGRKESSFDSSADPIVRVTARTLRKRLEAFYQAEGREHALRLMLPIGRYVPQFVRIEPTPLNGAMSPAGTGTPAAAPHIPWQLATSLLLLVFTLGFLAARQTFFEPSPIPERDLTWGEPFWSDEFNGAAGVPPDASAWSFVTGNNEGWGNGEAEVYCAPGSDVSPCESAHPNAFQDGKGHLVLRALKSISGTWTSARIWTLGLREFQYGRIEARMSLPIGNGLWPAFWMIGGDVADARWPECGSVDLVENVSNRNNASNLGWSTVRATIHGPGYSLGNGLYGNYPLPKGGRIDGFHVYGAIWSPNMIQFYVDDPENIFFIGTPSSIPPGARWVLDKPYAFVASLAVGGAWPGPSDASTPTPSDMIIDYVRVYKAKHVAGPSMHARPVVLNAGRSGGTLLSVSASARTGRVYLACSGAPVNTTCSLAMPVVNFADNPTQEIAVSISTWSVAGAQRYTTPAGEYSLTVTAHTISGDISTANISLRVK
jgi:beta-glucanase (GH16 family)